VVPPPEPVAPQAVPAPRKKTRLAGKPERPTRAREAAPTYRIPWADLLAKVFEIDVLACPCRLSRSVVIHRRHLLGLAHRRAAGTGGSPR